LTVKNLALLMIALSSPLAACAQDAPVAPPIVTPAQPEKDYNAMNRSEKIRYVYNALNKETMDVLDEFYAEDVVFEDPLGSIEGLPSLRAYYEGMYKNVQEIRFDISEDIEQDEKHVIIWTLHMRVKGLNGGEEVVSKGNSFLKFNDAGKVVYHRDYFDMGEFIYQHVPVLRFLVRQVNKRLEHKAE
jgi:limonene-1,2-epoxide hydrolase